MPVYEIINPSDPYTIEADFEAATIAITLLGKGFYGLKDGDKKMVVPLLFVFTENGTDDWFQNNLGGSTGEVLGKLKGDDIDLMERVIAALKSIVIGSFEEREVYNSMMVNLSKEEAASKDWTWHDERRTSLTDIRRAALAWASVLSQVVQKSAQERGETKKE